MNLSSFRHQSDSRYCFSLDDHRVLIRLAVGKECPLDEATLVYGDPMRFAKEHRYQKMEIRHEDRGFVYYETVMEAFPARFMYVFKLRAEGKEYYYSESGLDESYKFDLAFISAFQFVGENRNDFVLEKPSWQGRVFYQIFPERFASREDPKKKDYVNTPWDCKTLTGKHNAFLGGDLYGVIDKLDYLSSLGIGAIYLTPIHPSKSNHKYDVIDYFDVDPDFGGKEAFRELLSKAHDHGMKVMMDLVFNHFSCFHPFFLDVKEKGRASAYYDWFFIDGDKPTPKPLNYRCFGYFYGMPKVDTNNPKVQAYLISIASYWMKEFGVDGFRLDVSEGVSHDFWNRFKLALKDIDPEVLVLGENWLNSESYLGNNQLDGVMNYPFLGAASGYVLGIRDAKETAEVLEGLLMRYKEGHNRMMLNILSSHDVQRFVTLCHGDKDLSLLAYAMLIFYPGYPMIYYGEEIFMEGGHDPDNRQGMAWGSKEFASPRHELFKRLLALRKEEPLTKGETYIEGQGTLTLRRTYQGRAVTLVCNLTENSVPVQGRVLFGNRVAAGEVWPKGFAILDE